MANDTPQQPDQAAAARPSIRERLTSLWSRLRTAPAYVRQNPRRAALWGGGGLAAFVALVFGLVFLVGLLSSSNKENTLDKALAKLDAGQYQHARDIAAELLGSSSLAYNEMGGPSYVLGAALVHSAETHWSPAEQRTLYLIAARHLEEARDRRFPRGREANGLYLLGRSLYESGRYAQSLAPLLEAAQKNPQKQTEIYGMLAGAYRRDADPDLAKANEYIQKYLADRMLPPAERHDGLLQLAEILFDQGDSAACRDALQQIPANAHNRPLAILLSGRLLIREGDEELRRAASDPDLVDEATRNAADKYQQAIQAFQLAQARDTSTSRATPKALYLQGVCRLKLGDLPAALKLFALVRRSAPETEESLVAALSEAETLLGDAQADAALELYERILQQAGPPDQFSNSWLSLAVLRDRYLRAYSRFIDGGYYEQAVQLTRRMPSHFDLDETVRLRALAYESWAQGRMEEAGVRATLEAEALRAEARWQRRRAGRAYQRLAQLWVARREYPDVLWSSAESYLRGRDYERAVKLLEEYLQNEARSKRPRALVAKGEALLALGQVEEAAKPLQLCIEEHARDPQSYQARLMLSRVNMELGLVAEAKQPLLANLENDELTPQSAEWRDSLFALGEVFYREGLALEAQSRQRQIAAASADAAKAGLEELEQSNEAFRQAIRRLDEAVQRYPESPAALEAHYMMAEAHRRAAKLSVRKFALATIDSTRGEQKRQMEQDLEAAAATYAKLQTMLDPLRDAGGMSPLEEAVLRNCCFHRAHALFALERYEEAIAAYSLATTRYQTEPEVLEAYVQIAACHRRLGRRGDAKNALEQAKLVIAQRIAADADFTRTTNYDRNAWIDRLQWLSSL